MPSNPYQPPQAWPEKPGTGGPHPDGLSTTGRYLILAAAFLGWMFSGAQMTSTSLVSGSATEEFAKAGRMARESYVELANLLVFSPSTPTPNAWSGTEVSNELLNKQLKPKWYA